MGGAIPAAQAALARIADAFTALEQQSAALSS
jgi:hypothetical protein